MSRYKPRKMWGVLTDDMLVLSLCQTRETARGLAKSCRRVRDMRGGVYPVRIVRVEVRINDV
jgi:hypothetical protein